MPTKAQMRKIWASARELDFDEDQLRSMARDVSGSSSLSSLTFAEAGKLIDRMVRLGATASPSYKRTKPRGRKTEEGEILLITGEQRQLIQQLREQLGDNWTRRRYFEGACKRLIRKPHPRTAGDGARVIEMLKARLKHQEGQRG